MTKQPAIYILASKRNGTLFGVTGDLVKRVWQHKNDVLECFTKKKYGVYTLVYYEMYTTMAEAIRREKQLEKWNRA